MKLLAIDGNSIINRAFYGIRPLTAADGTPTNGVYGFLAILGRILGEEKPDAVCVAFDLPGPTFRHERYDGYKATRKGMPDDLAVQMPILKEVLDAMNIKRFELSGWEADDLLGTLAKKCESEHQNCVIVTGDKDSLQLVSKYVTVKHIKTRGGQTETTNYTPEVFREEYGFEPELIVDFKALMGDSSDNIPGVSGVGEITAKGLIRKYGRISYIYQNIDELDIKDTIKVKLLKDEKKAELSYELAEIQTDAPFDFDFENCLCKEYNNDELFTLFTRLRFSNFINKYRLKPPASSSAVSGETYKMPEVIDVVSAEMVRDFLKAVSNAPYVSIALDTEFFDSFSVALKTGDGESDYSVYSLYAEKFTDFNSALLKVLSTDLKKVAHNVKDIIRACLERGLNTSNWVFDTALAAYIVSPTDSDYDLPRISLNYCGFSLDDDTSGNGQMTITGSEDTSISRRAFSILLLKDILEQKLVEAQQSKLYFDIELPLCSILAKMECSGVLIDKAALIDYGKILAAKISNLEQEIYQSAGEEFNINSPKQLGVILFDKLMLSAPKKTKTGYSTSVEILDKLINAHPIIKLIKDYRELAKLKSTYADGLLKVIGKDGRIHTHFQMTVTATGRLSSTDPNLQNIPVRRETGNELRKMFIAAPGHVLVDADYSQIELRLLAHIANDPVMIAAFLSGDDIHAVTASQVFNVPLNEVTAEQRSRAKAVNFGIVYGISAFSLAEDIGVSNKEAKEYIDNYLEKYSGVKAYMKDIVRSAAELGYAATLFSRRRYLPELKSGNFNTRSFGERVALNMPIQGTAADIMKIAMVNVSTRLDAEKLTSKLILQVHDELIVECPETLSSEVCRILQEEMENAAKLRVPLVAETKIGKSWNDAK